MTLSRHPLPVLSVAISLLSSPAVHPATEFTRGEVNADGHVDIGDALALLFDLHAGQRSSMPRDALDANDDGAIDSADVVTVLAFLFLEGEPPAAPFPEPGFDPTPDDPFTEGDPLPGPRPDLSATVTLSTRHVILVQLENQGPEPVGAGVGSLEIWVDGYLVREVALDEVPDATFRQSGGSSTFDTGIRLRGSSRRVAVIVDPDDEIAEENELQNTDTVTLNVAAKTFAPDVDIYDLGVDVDGNLTVTVFNRYSRNLQEGGDVPLVVEIGATRFERTVTVPPLSGPTRGNPEVPTAVLTLDPPVPVPTSSTQPVMVRIDTSSLADADTSNAIRTAYLPLDLDPYAGLVAQLQDFIVWEDQSGVRSLEEWTDSMQGELFDAIVAVDLGRPFPIENPPSGRRVGSTLHYLPATAWTMYLGHVAQALHVEVRDRVAWKIFPQGLEEGDTRFLPHFLDSRELFDYDAAEDLYRFVPGTTAWDPRVGFEHLSTLGLIRDTQEETIFAFTEWARAHVRHSVALDVDAWGGYPGRPPIDRCLYRLVDRDHIAAGCGGMTGIYWAALKSVNIPVTTAFTMLGGPGSHFRPEFPTVDLSMPHADDVYSAILIPTGDHPVPASGTFYTLEEMHTLFHNPAVDCDAVCNSPGEQASYNSRKDMILATIKSGSDWPLYTYLLGGASGLDEHLTHIPNGASPIVFAKPLFTETQRAAFVSSTEERLAQLGGGDLGEGLNVVGRRVGNFAANKTRFLPLP